MTLFASDFDQPERDNGMLQLRRSCTTNKFQGGGSEIAATGVASFMCFLDTLTSRTDF